MLVLMALVTTTLTGPLVTFFQSRQAAVDAHRGASAA
jgi:hypothetical protein